MFVEVMVETKKKVQPPNERLKGARNEIVYIKYDQDLEMVLVCNRRSIEIKIKCVFENATHVSLVRKLENNQLRVRSF